MIKHKKIKPSHVLKHIYHPIQDTHPTINSFLPLHKQNPIKKPQQFHQLQPKHQIHPKLFPIPMAIKHNIITNPLQTTSPTKILQPFLPIYQSTLMQKLHKDNPVLIPKLNMDHFAIRASTQTSYF
ncbi:amidase family protein, partial [Staphylococcus aureus]|uniref:amidase family protein n=1 Tax=Staphylococcus aureus TaxID=1280 RepID=UPI0021B16CAC